MKWCKTTCCTAIGAGNGAATPQYLLGECWQVVQLFDEKGNVVGMSRVFMGEINNEKALMMDNIELNKTYVKGMTDQEKMQIRDGIFEYMHSYSTQVTGCKDSKVFFYHSDVHVPTHDLTKIEANVTFVGQNPTDRVYVNASGCQWINPAEFVNLKSGWLIVPNK